MEKELNLRAFFKVTYGLYIVTSCHENKATGLIANTVCQVTAAPPRISVCIGKESLTHELISRSGIFAVSVLDESTPLKFIGIFGFNSGRRIDKLSLVCHAPGVTGCPVVVENTIAVFEAKVTERVDVVTHSIFIAEVVAAREVNPGRPLTYAYYREHLRGKTPKSAPSYVPPEEEKGALKGGRMQKYICNVCGYVYDPATGDPDNGVPAGTPFEKLPDSWVCPVCGAGKDQFSPEAA